MQTDVLIIGAGPGGYRAAEYAAKQGLQVVIVEQAEVGGTCLNRGCIPTKTYVHSATFADAIERMPQVVAQLRAGVEGILAAPGITLLRGKAQFVGPDTVSVCGDAVAADTTVTAKSIVIATGSSAKMPPIAGIDTDTRVMTSTGLLQLQALPRRLCIVGAGVVGMEFASVFQRFGSEVTVVEFLKECLPMLDSDIAKRLRKLLEKRGITFRMKTAVQSLADMDADAILIATGRKPNVSADFAKAGFEYDERKGVTVDDNFQTTVKGIYAIGDVNGRQMLAHAAEMQAVRAVNHILGRRDGIRFDIMPSAIFTEPEAACVGPSEEQLKAQGADYLCRKAFWRSNGKALAMNETEGMLKLFVAASPDGPDAGRILGCHAYGAHAADMVQEVSALMCRDTTLSQLRDMVHIHPTLSEILRAAAE
ncbi:MAG: NAD(P)/FAD-dependent oxidoreductase [Prevotella sp.]|nr:NAD(P)/FAD-dependent oxidoreductase [Prevotella sp.]